MLDGSTEFGAIWIPQQFWIALEALFDARRLTAELRNMFESTKYIGVCDACGGKPMRNIDSVVPYCVMCEGGGGRIWEKSPRATISAESITGQHSYQRNSVAVVSILWGCVTLLGNYLTALQPTDCASLRMCADVRICPRRQTNSAKPRLATDKDYRRSKTNCDRYNVGSRYSRMPLAQTRAHSDRTRP
jgi:hypothetical protein